ncbi:unnamed protein product [Alopecurus aequalis]
MAAKKNQQTTTSVVDPKFEWAEKESSYLLRLLLPGLRKDDFRVQVDRAGRLTVRGTRPNTGAAGLGSFSKVFQLPSAASLDDIAGGFEAGVLTLTVPKRACGAGAPTSIEAIKTKHPDVATKENKVAKEETGKGTTGAKEEELKPKAPQAAVAALWLKPKTAIGSDKAKLAADRESLAERVRRHGVQERAKAAAAATAAMNAIVEPEKKETASNGGWKKRVQGELKVLADMKWADGLAEAAKNNKEVVAVGIAAFSLGFLVSQKLLRK